MNLSQVIANKFNISIDDDREWVAIRCPFHSDEHASAGISFQHKYFNCFSGCDPLPFKKFAKKLGLETNGFEEDSDWLNNFISDDTPSRPLVLRKQAEAYANFLIERKIKPETIEEIGGYYESREESNDYGFLVIEYRKNKYIKRRILGTGERFRNTTGDTKDLFGRLYTSNSSIILVEGITDYCTLWQRGYKNIVASFGAKVSRQQMFLLRNKIVFILFDTDYEGFVGARKAAKYLNEYGATAIPLEIPNDFGDKDTTKIDVNSAYCHSGEKFFDWLNYSISQYSSFDVGYVNTWLSPSKNRNKFRQISTRLSKLDNLLGGGFSTGLHLIGGRTEIGKTSLTVEIANAAIEQGVKVLMVSYEVSKEQMWARLASRESDYSWSEIEKDQSLLEPMAVTKLTELANRVRIELGWTIDQVEASAKFFDLIILDYIQRIPIDGNDKRIGVSNNGARLSNIARDTGKVIICISSLPNNPSEGVFKESGDLIYMGQSGWLLHKVEGNLVSLENIKNTRNQSGGISFMRLDYAHQRATETEPMSLERMIG